ncbi:ComF family protein [Waterburya agarophytonicola K14]|uniref:ComF family protein n=1 Tax=Waterburya agarophytonicola KI4 TaxID=2874699 RepID=A0A964BTU1_9CYAN|nr:ComF family protein [Waterburya agarophytonicola]MCC0177740.1 ComF family protein [Waterburya agarophytonicola KI4]
MFKQLLSVFLESQCPCCQKTTAHTFCKYCFNKLSSHQLKQPDRTGWWGETPVFAWGRYDGQLKRAIALMKYDNHPEIGIMLGKLLAKTWLASNLAKFTKISVIPIPLHHHKMKERSFNQAEKIALGFCQLTGYSLSSQALIRVKKTQAMFDLSPEERIKNLQGAFRLGKKPPQHPVLLLDDIYTMGTTIKESAKILRRNQIKVIGSVVVAKTSSYN